VDQRVRGAASLNRAPAAAGDAAAGIAQAIELSAVRFRWRAQRSPCLSIAHFALASGERVFLHGESGSGKSTLLNLIAGVLLPEAGSLRVLDQELARLSGSARDRLRADHIGFVFQQFNLIPYLSVMENVLLALRFSPRRAARAGGGSRARAAEVARLLASLDLDPALQTRTAAELSVGQQQRVAVARALIGSPEIVIADEPTSSLDAVRQQAFMELLLEECGRAHAALLFVSHDLRLARHFGRCVAMADINLAEAGS